MSAYHRPKVRHSPLIRLTVSLVAGAVLLTGACGDADDSGDAQSLTVMDYYTDEPSNTHIGRVFDTCGSKVGVDIERQSVPGPQLMPKVLQQASSRTLPDILMLNNPDVQQVAEMGALTPLDDLGLNTDGYVDALKSAVTFKGEAYGLGSTSNTLALFYNKQMFERAGLKPPRTWPKLVETAKHLTTGSRYGIAFAAPSDYEAAWQFLPFLWSNGGSETRLDSPEAEEALQLWVDLVESGSASRSVVNWRQTEVKDQFVAGKAAMMVNGPWQIPELKASDVDWDVVQLPVPSAGDTPVAPLGGEVWTVPVNDSQKKTAKARQVLRCVLSDANALRRAKEAFQVPSKLAVARQYAADVPSMRPFVEQVTAARALTGRLGTRYPSTAKALYQAIQAALSERATPRRALRQAQQSQGS